MYKLYTNTSYAEGVRVLSGQVSGEFATYDEAIAMAINWLKQNPTKILMDICIVFEGDPNTLEIGQRYDIYRGVLAYSGKTIIFDEIEIQESPYKITGIYRGSNDEHTRMTYSKNGKSYIKLENAKEFHCIEGMSYGEKWAAEFFRIDEKPDKWGVVVGTSTFHYTETTGTKVAEFNSEDEAKWRLYEMVLSGWEASSSLYSPIGAKPLSQNEIDRALEEKCGQKN
jgi:hypothetical protein